MPNWRVALFGRRTFESAVHPITAFWAWWDESGYRIDPSRTSAQTDELTRRVDAIHPSLTWHFGPGTNSTHRLTVSASGDAGVRPAAERWFRAAPPPSSTWEFRPSQEAEAGALSNVLEIAGEKIDLTATVFRVEPVEEELRVHVGVHHPSFAQLPERARAEVTYLLLDWLIGEDDVERWLGHIEPLGQRPQNARTAQDVRAAVAKIAAARDPDQWVLAHWQDEKGAPGLASFRRGLRWIDTPTFDLHQIIAVKYKTQDNGLPVSLDHIREIESELEEQLGARGILVGHETHKGVRTFHAYTDGDDQNADAALQAWTRERRLALTSRPDPAWKEVRHFTG